MKKIRKIKTKKYPADLTKLSSLINQYYEALNIAHRDISNSESIDKSYIRELDRVATLIENKHNALYKILSDLDNWWIGRMFIDDVGKREKVTRGIKRAKKR